MEKFASSWSFRIRFPREQTPVDIVREKDLLLVYFGSETGVKRLTTRTRRARVPSADLSRRRRKISSSRNRASLREEGREVASAGELPINEGVPVEKFFRG